MRANIHILQNEIQGLSGLQISGEHTYHIYMLGFNDNEQIFFLWYVSCRLLNTCQSEFFIKGP